MKSIRTTMIAASLLAGFSGLIMAQNAATAESSHMGHGQKMHTQRAEQHAQHLGDLKSKLNLTADQATAWQSFEQSMQSRDHHSRPDRAAFEKMTTPERIDQMQAMKAQRDAAMQKHAQATKTFYVQLNAEQKKVFDAQGLAAMGGMRGMGSGMQPARHGHHGAHAK